MFRAVFRPALFLPPIAQALATGKTKSGQRRTLNLLAAPTAASLAITSVRGIPHKAARRDHENSTELFNPFRGRFPVGRSPDSTESNSFYALERRQQPHDARASRPHRSPAEHTIQSSDASPSQRIILASLHQRGERVLLVNGHQLVALARHSMHSTNRQLRPALFLARDARCPARSRCR